MLLGSESRSTAVPLWLVTEGQLPQFLAQLDPPAAAWLRSHGFQAERARIMTIPGGQGGIAAAVGGLGTLANPSQLSLWDAAACAERRPATTRSLPSCRKPWRPSLPWGGSWGATASTAFAASPRAQALRTWSGRVRPMRLSP